MSSENKPQANSWVLVEQCNANLDALEGMIEKGKRQADEKLVHIRRNLEGSVKNAAAFTSEIEAVQSEYGPVLDRMAALDMQALRTFHGYNLLDNISEDAKRVRQELAGAIRHLGTIPNRVNGLTTSNAALDWQRIDEDAKTYAGFALRMHKKIQQLQERMAKFEAALNR